MHAHKLFPLRDIVVDASSASATKSIPRNISSFPLLRHHPEQDTFHISSSKLHSDNETIVHIILQAYY